jgi:hypothetical protein
VTPAAQPLVAFVCRAPVLSEALAASLTLVADVRSFPAGRPDPEGLIRALRPDAIVVDDPHEADRLAPYARVAQSPLILIAIDTDELRVLRGSGWEVVSRGDGIDGIRNLLVAQLFGRAARREKGYAVNGETAPDPA